MPKFEITAPNGRKYEVHAPEGASQDEVLAYAKENYKSATSEPAASTSENIKQGAGNLIAGAVRGAGSIGATLLAPIDMAKDALDGKGLSLESNRQRRADMDSALQSMGAEPESWMYKGGKLAGEIAGTAGAGGVMANGVRAVGATRAMSGLEPITNAVAAGLETGGFRVGELAGTVPGAVARVATGAATGGASAALVNPEDAGVGAAIGGAFPIAAKAVGHSADKIRKGMQSILGKASPEVQQLAMRAEELGIKIPADRILDSKALNAMASSLNYIPMSGRTATEEAMNSQLNKALSRTFGQDSSNVTQALRLAQDKLGSKFEATLTANGVAFDNQLLDDLASVYNKAETELGSEGLRPIESKIKEIVAKGETGLIDGRAAYNIKRDLDRLGKANTPNAWHAVELKRVLMDALDRSLGPEKAAEFATVRQQYGNMLSLEKLAKNGVEGEISVARLANLPNINNPQLQEIADIAAQFVKPREAAHGSAQRVFGAGGAGVAAALGAIGVPLAGTAAIAAGGVMGAGRVVNKALNSEAMRNSILSPMARAAEPATMGRLTQGIQRALPLTGAAMAGGAMAQEDVMPGPARQTFSFEETGPTDPARQSALESAPMDINGAVLPDDNQPEAGPAWGAEINGAEYPGDDQQSADPAQEFDVQGVPIAAEPPLSASGINPAHAFTSQPRPDGTLAIAGDTQALRTMLAAAGIPASSLMTTKGGILIGRSQAGKVQDAIDRMNGPMAGAPAANVHAQSGQMADAAPVEGQGMPQELAASQAPVPSIADIGKAQTVGDAISAASAAMGAGRLAAAPPQSIVEAEPVAVSMALPPVDGVMSSEPMSTWYGRRGDGYEALGDAQMALRTRQKAAPEMQWRVETMPSGRYRLAGYQPEQADETMGDGMGQTAAAPSGDFEPIPQADGTLAIRGDPSQIRQLLAHSGISAIPGQGAVLVGRSQAQAAMQVLGASSSAFA